VILGAKGTLAGSALLFIEDLDGLLSGGLLAVVDHAQVEDVPLHHGEPDRRLSTMEQERCSLPSFLRELHLRNMPAGVAGAVESGRN
jgi:hypothetical protein